MQNNKIITMAYFGEVCTQLGKITLDNGEIGVINCHEVREDGLITYKDSHLFQHQKSLGYIFEEEDLLEDPDFAKEFLNLRMLDSGCTVNDLIATYDRRESHLYGITTIAMRPWLTAVASEEGIFSSYLMSARYSDRFDPKRLWLTDLELTFTVNQHSDQLALTLTYIRNGKDASKPVTKFLKLSVFMAAKDPTAFIKCYITGMIKEIKPY